MEQKQTRGTAARLGLRSPAPWAQCPGEDMLPLAWGPSPSPRHSHMHVHVQMLVQLDACSCRVARHGGPLLREVNSYLNKSNQQTTASLVLDVCLLAPKPCYCSSSTDVTLTKLAHKHSFQKQPTDQPDKISWQLSFTRGHNIFQQFTSISFLTPSSLEEMVIPSVLHSGVCQISSICSVTHPWWSFRSHPLFFSFWKPVNVLFYSPDHAYWASL